MNNSGTLINEHRQAHEVRPGWWILVDECYWLISSVVPDVVSDTVKFTFDHGDYQTERVFGCNSVIKVRY